jgi:feruloyl esterase
MKIGYASRALLPALGSIVLAACGGGGDGGPAEEPAPPVQQQIACAELPQQFKSAESNVVIASATPVAAAGSDPAYCDVRGTIRGNIKFAVYMPTSWNGRFQMVGNGGKAGNISFPAMLSAVREGYAASSTDTGHDNATPGQGGARFGYDVEFGDGMEIDFGYRAVHLTAVVSKEVIRAHYPDDIAFSYWNGCSTGGRQGLMEAQRFPDDFDGYAVGAPVYNYVRQQLSAPALLGNLYKNGITGGSELPPAKRDLIGNIVYNGNGGNYPGCDAIDGVVDGQIRNPLKCNFNPAVHVPLCSGGDAPDCLTFSELQAVQGVYAGKPEVGVLPLPVGSESTAGGWGSWLITNSGSAPTLHGVMVDAFQYLLFEPDRPNFDYLTQFNWGSDPYMMEKAKQNYNATNPDLRTFAANGKKIIMYHGWTDPGVNPMGTLEYKASVEQTFGSQNAVDAFMKLYMVPGLGHCNGGPGHTQIDWMTPLARWVEEGSAPVAIVGIKPGTSSTRPHCPHPTEAVYDGTGDPDLAASYACRLP